MSPTALEGWTFNDHSRSSWDIVWTCLTTIFACTWTVLHMSVPRRNSSEGLVLTRKLARWTIALLAPEQIVLIASDEFWRVWSLRAQCNGAQADSDRRTGEPDSWLYRRSKPLAEVEVALAAAGEDRELKLHPAPAHWTLAQCWCVQMGGATLKTEDGDCTEREIKDRAKADTLAKAFTVCQSAWVTANIVARAGYGLPITPFEFATLSTWRCRLPFPCDTRDAMPAEIRRRTDARPNCWMHRHVIPPSEGIGAGFAFVGSRYQHDAVDEPVSGIKTREYRGLSLREESWLNTFAGVAAVLFCGIHVAAWNFAFPTHAEANGWRVFSLVALGMPVIV
ncbi:hypothetical protein BDV10DRAFT_182638 [Aspergillus recurvatus]